MRGRKFLFALCVLRGSICVSIVAVLFSLSFLSPSLSLPCCFFFVFPFSPFGVLHRPSPHPMFMCKKDQLDPKKVDFRVFSFPLCLFWTTHTGSQFNLLTPSPSSLSLPSRLSRHKVEVDGNIYQTILYHFTEHLLFLTVISLYLAVTSFRFY